MKNPFLIGTKVYLRPLEREDAPFFVAWMNDPDVKRTLGVYRPFNLLREEEYIDRVYKNEHDIFAAAQRSLS